VLALPRSIDMVLEMSAKVYYAIKPLILVLILITILTTQHSLLHIGTSTDTEDLELEFIQLIPSTSKNITARGECGTPWSTLSIGNASIDPNLWGLADYDCFSGLLEVKVDEKGYFKVIGELDLSNMSLKPWNVIAYPEVIYGFKPWGVPEEQLVSSKLVLPQRLVELPKIIALVDYTVLDSSTGLNLAFDIWLLRSRVPRPPRQGDVEIMVWLYSDGSPRPIPAGIFVKSVEQQVVFDGIPRVAIFDIYVERSVGNGWTYIAFSLRESVERGEIILDISSLLDIAIEILGFKREELYLTSIELGFEVFYSNRVLIKAAIYKYVLVVDKSLRASVKDVLSFTPKSSRLVTWITPWGYLYNPLELPIHFTPGVVVAYDVNCGLCTSVLREWLRESLKYIEFYLNMNRVVYVNFFCEKYVLEWEWRGFLDRVVLNDEVLDALRSVIGDGVNTYIGFSELTTCVNNETCRELLIGHYKYLKRAFPAARFYYYGSSGDDIGALLDLYVRAKLNYIGIDIWDYRLTESGVIISEHVTRKLLELHKQLSDKGLFIGEIGLRINDREAYIEPWRPDRPIVYDEMADELYYRDILKHLGELEIGITQLGIWAWNDGSFAIREDLAVQNTIQSFAIKLGLIPSLHTLEEEKAFIETINISIIYYIVIIITVFLLLYFLLCKRRK